MRSGITVTFATILLLDHPEVSVKEARVYLGSASRKPGVSVEGPGNDAVNFSSGYNVSEYITWDRLPCMTDA